MINNIYYLPPWVSVRTYVDLAQKEGLQVCGVSMFPYGVVVLVWE